MKEYTPMIDAQNYPLKQAVFLLSKMRRRLCELWTVVRSFLQIQTCYNFLTSKTK